jgi:hypothetical protein|tara:strand:- start:64 stop:267 length:204 start_codon:yes stop_codon:yes gene_type:complete
MEIEVYTRRDFGTERTYIADPDIKDAIITLTGKKSLTRWDMRALERLGHTFSIVLDPESKLITSKTL